MNSKKDIPTQEDLDFIVDDGYKHDVDPDYIPEKNCPSDDEKYIVTGKDFKKLIRNAKKLCAESLDYSTRKNNKYMAILPSGKKFILDRQIIQTILFTKTKIDEINIFLELKR